MNWKQFLASKGISEEDYAKKSVEEMAQLQAEYFDARIAKASTVEQLNAVKNDFETFKSNYKEVDEDKYKSTIEELEEKVAKLEEGTATQTVVKSFAEQVREQLEANKEALAAIKGNSNKEVTFKVVGTQTTSNITLPSATPASYTYQQNPVLIPAPDLIPFVQNWTDNGSTDQVALAYVDEVGQEGDADFIGEGVVKPLIDIDYEIRYSQAKKVAGKIKVSEEALTDIPFMEAEINRKLRQRHDLELQDGILNGAGGATDLEGITTRAAAFAAGGLATSIDNAQNYDVIVAAYNQILITSDSNYIPNAVFVHPTDATLMKLTKDSDGNYLMPPFATESGDVINNVRVVQNTKIPVGYFLMGDFSKAHVRNYVDFSIRVGYTGDDFEKNLVTILGESRVHLWMSENEEAAFVYDQFSVAKTALETP